MTSSDSSESKGQILPEVNGDTLYSYYSISINTFLWDIYQGSLIVNNLGNFYDSCNNLLSDVPKTDEVLTEKVNQLDMKTILLALINYTSPSNDFRDPCKSVAQTYRDMTEVFRWIQTHVEQIVKPRKNVKLHVEIFRARCIVYILKNKLGDTKSSKKTPADSSFTDNCIYAFV